MDVPCEVQGNIHVCLALFNMCPVFWVHIKFMYGTEFFFLLFILSLRFFSRFGEIHCNQAYNVAYD